MSAFIVGVCALAIIGVLSFGATAYYLSPLADTSSNSPPNDIKNIDCDTMLTLDLNEDKEYLGYALDAAKRYFDVNCVPIEPLDVSP